MWSPKTKANGDRNPYYHFMTQVRPGDLVFSFAGGRIIAIGLAVSAFYEAPKPTDFGAAGQSWSEDGWAVDVDFQRVPKPLKPLEHMHVLYPLLPPKYSPLRANGQGKELYLTSIPLELGTLLLELIGSPELAMQVTDLSDLSYSEEEQLIVQDAVLEETMKASLVLARRGQGKFRKRVAFFEGSCRVTGVSSENLLIASHIKPWASSSNEERLNGHNGLFLSPHIDKLFDTGLMSFENNGAMLFSEALDLNVLERWNIDPTKKVKKFGQDQSYFLAQHRENVFK
jgi:putative restriction endonuclease